MKHPASIAPAEFRDTLGCYPTGVCVVTTCQDDLRIGITVGSFSSISLDPPIVGFFIDKRSRRWPAFAAAGRFCVNVLGAEQTEICKDFSKSPEGSPSAFSTTPSPLGLPLVTNATAWIDCTIQETIELGDHLLVVGAVQALKRQTGQSPLVFAKGQFCEPVAAQ